MFELTVAIKTSPEKLFQKNLGVTFFANSSAKVKTETMLMLTLT